MTSWVTSRVLVCTSQEGVGTRFIINVVKSKIVIDLTVVDLDFRRYGTDV